ncbi:MAG TPA: hypothetical protein VKX16_16765 [Chloroflexota bacterium]|nr:hypothetical protein [Chloroflexota bacterium]
MRHVKSTAIGVSLGAALLVAAPALAVSGGVTSPNLLTAATALTNLQFGATCGQIAAISPNHLTIRRSSGPQLNISVSSRTFFMTRGLEKAQSGPRVGEYAAASAGSTAASGVLAVLYARRDFCPRATPAVQNSTIKGTVAGYSAQMHTILVSAGTATSHAVYRVAIVATTRFYVNGAAVASTPTFVKGEQIQALGKLQAIGVLVANTVWLTT